MVFSSITFLFFFLPATLFLYWVIGSKRHNILLLAASLFFYAWGEGIYVLLMLASIVINYTTGRLIDNFRASPYGRYFLITGIFSNLLILSFYKYAHFVTDNLNVIMALMEIPLINLNPIRLPIGISFFTFQALSYIIDVYRNKVTPQKNFINLALYISMFPQLIAGPIVRYHDIAKEISNRKISINGLANGIQRFIYGLSKKVLLANPLAEIADAVFALPETGLTTPLAWLGALCYTLQIYFDFSGYSDMAIGLGRMFGFHFLENFNYPYISKSIREFWRRWHISLSSWLRDYVYIPLGGNRRGGARTHMNLLIVFFLCGLWHGASWTFVAWGLYHGFFLIMERSAWGRFQQKLWTPIQILLTFLVVMIGWVIFRCETLPAAGHYISIMFRAYNGLNEAASLSQYIDAKSSFEMVIAVLIVLPLYPSIGRVLSLLTNKLKRFTRTFYDISSNLILLSMNLGLVYFSVISLAAGVYNPFIYFRF